MFALLCFQKMHVLIAYKIYNTTAEKNNRVDMQTNDNKGK